VERQTSGNDVTEQAHLKLRVEEGATAQMQTFVEAFAARHRLGNDDRARALIVAEELITNLVKYGYRDRTGAGAAEVHLLLDEGRLTIELNDDACAFDPFDAPAPDPNRPPECRPVGGLGLRIVRLLSEGRQYSRVNERNVTRVTLRLSSSSES